MDKGEQLEQIHVNFTTLNNKKKTFYLTQIIVANHID